MEEILEANPHQLCWSDIVQEIQAKHTNRKPFWAPDADFKGIGMQEMYMLF